MYRRASIRPNQAPWIWLEQGGRQSPCSVVVPKTGLPDSEHWPEAAEHVMAFASEDAHGISFKAWLRKDHPRAQQILHAWDRYQDTTYFEEWVANTDRHLGNILYDGEYWLIDHGRAFNVPHWPTLELDPYISYTNELFRVRMQDISQHERYQWRRDSARFAELCQTVQCEGIAGQAQELSQELLQDAAIFLEHRAAHLVGPICRRLKIPELDLQVSP